MGLSDKGKQSQRGVGYMGSEQPRILPIHLDRLATSTSDYSRIQQPLLADVEHAQDEPHSSAWPERLESSHRNSLVHESSLSISVGDQQHSPQSPSSTTDTLSQVSIDDVDDFLPDDVVPSPVATATHSTQPDEYNWAQHSFTSQADIPTGSERIRPLVRRDLIAAASSIPASKLTLPSSYPSSIASSWSRPERSVWFQQKAIIITSIFLAIFIVLFIGAAVFLRDRKYDDEYWDESEEAQVERMVSERVQAGLAPDGSSGDNDRDGGDAFAAEKSKKKSKRMRSKIFRLGGKKLDEKQPETGTANNNEREPSTGSSSAVRRSRHLVSRWARVPARRMTGSRETVEVSGDAVSIRSGVSASRASLRDPRATERVEILYDDRSNDADASAHDSSAGSSGASPIRDGAITLTPSAEGGSQESGGESGVSAGSRWAPNTPPPPLHAPLAAPASATEQSASASSQAGSDSARSPRGASRTLDQSDFHAADAAENATDAGHLPPAYISSNHGGRSVQPGQADNTRRPMADSQADVKRSLPPPEELDRDLPDEVLCAAMAMAEEEDAAPPRSQALSAASAHVATDDKTALDALYASASAPARSPNDDAAPTYAADSSSAPAPNGPSAPALDVDQDGFEMPEDAAAEAGPSSSRPNAAEDGKGKGKDGLPAPPQAIEPAFSRFDQPYRSEGPPGPASPPASVPSGRRSPSAKEREALAELVSSSPADFASSTSPSVPSAPAFESLPVYVRSQPADAPTSSSSSSAPSAPQSHPDADSSAPSAPPL